ncbi:CRAL-TRIO lipid binding domain containing protein [Parasponia andersonii]|uniref:CRAL-TRIO lipid binding domain containing protein n=1 Tax=Parasponia andersonii TaxID=3476 RepID=A0A2P5C7K0_PARAD|nr:CRAL-TRIO lipid binding domain containing protein [Parasponia andersonii]
MDLNIRERENDDNHTNIEEQVVEMKDERVGEAVAMEEDEEETATREMAEIEKSKVAIMRALVQREDPSSKEVDDLMLRRFLRARDMDIEKASNMFLKYLNWRHSFVPTGSISASQIPNEIAQNKLFMQGFDRNGRPIILVYGGRHKQLKLDDFKRFVVLCLDKICARMPRGQEKFLAIGDLQGWGYANSDVRGYLGALSILQDCYPERLGKLFLVHVPYIFMTAWKMVYPFIDKNTKKKIMFVENKKLKSTLLSDIDESQLPEIYGGKLPLVPIQDC